MMLRKTLFYLSIITISSCIATVHIPAPYAYASENFSTVCDVHYTVDDTGLTTVRQNITITNLTSKFFVSKYSLNIGNEEIQDIKAWDTAGPLTPEIEKKDGGTTVTLNLQARVYGTGKQTKFGISYKFPGIASRNGLLWEINLLRIAGLGEVASYNLTLSVPNSFGPLLYASPLPKSTTDHQDRKVILYTKEELRKGPPRLAFGEFQLYRLQLNYHLENQSIALGYTEIAFPPDIPNQQKVIVKNIFPKPANVRIDKDGNYLARYNLGPRERKKVVWEGLVAMFYQPRLFTDDKANAIPAELVKLYTPPAKYWEVDDPVIIAKAQELTNPNLPVAKNAERIFDFVRNYLSYDQTRIAGGDFTRLGAAAALNSRDKAVCMEYSDLFIALARAAGIPAREINGYAYTADELHRPLSLQLQDGDVLHAWAEVYLPGSGWVMVDPTWSATSGSDYFSVFDLSHITFVVKGISSEYPLPAGSYKTESRQRDVRISMSSETTVVDQLPHLSVDIDFPALSVSPFPTTATIRIVNDSGITAFNVKAVLSSNLLMIEGDKTINLGTIPPGGVIRKEIRLIPEKFTTKGTQILSVAVSSDSFKGETLTESAAGKTEIHPLYLPLPLPYFAGLVTIICLSIWFNRTVIRRIKNR